MCHVSTSGSVGLIREAKARGVAVTAEVTPHHLLLTEELVTGFDPLFKVNPPLRTTSDTVALRQALAEGVIDVIATDHAPHPAEAKDTTFPEAAFGMLGLESALGVAITTMVESGMMGYQDIARVMSSAPAAIGRLGGYDNPLALGAPAHLTLVDPTATTPHPRASLSHNNPYRDMSLRGRAMFTFYGGVLTVREGELVEREADES
ncbi:MAG: hypothetical protein RL187_393 [Actinomycetota bacterium]